MGSPWCLVCILQERLQNPGWHHAGIESVCHCPGRIAQVGIDEISTTGIGVTEAGVPEVGLGEVSTTEIGGAKVGVRPGGQIQSAQVQFGEVSAAKAMLEVLQLAPCPSLGTNLFKHAAVQM